MSNDVKNLFRVMGGIALGALFMILYQNENPPTYTVDWRDVGKIISTDIRSDVFYAIKTDKGEFHGIDREAATHLKKYTVGKTLYKFYVVKQLKWPNMKTTRSIGQVDIQYGVKGGEFILDGGTLNTGAIKW